MAMYVKNVFRHYFRSKIQNDPRITIVNGFDPYDRMNLEMNQTMKHMWIEKYRNLSPTNVCWHDLVLVLYGQMLQEGSPARNSHKQFQILPTLVALIGYPNPSSRLLTNSVALKKPNFFRCVKIAYNFADLFKDSLKSSHESLVYRYCWRCRWRWRRLYS